MKPIPEFPTSMDEKSANEQIDRMVNFIETECEEHINDVNNRIEEDYLIEKEKIKREGKKQIDDEYKKKEEQLELNHKMEIAQLKNQARMNLMKSKEDSVDHILEEAKTRLSQVAEDRTKYAQIMELLLLQGLLALLEPTVQIRCLETDLCLVQNIFPRVSDSYKSITDMSVELKIDRINLESECAGGIDLSTPSGQLYLSNTLESRLNLMALQARPQIRDILFGTNPNRMFSD